MAGEQKNKVEIVVEVTGGGKVRQELAAVKSGLASVNAEVQKSSQAVTSGLAPFGNSIRAQTAELKQAEAQMRSFGNSGLAGLRNMGAAARQDLQRLAVTTGQLTPQSGQMVRTSGLAASAVNGFGVAAQFAGVGFLAGAGAVAVLGEGIEFLIEHTTGLTSATKNALAITNDDIRLRMDSVAAIEAQVAAFENQGSAIATNTDRLRANLTAQKEILAFDLGTRVQGIGEAFTRQNENLQRFRAVNEPTQLFQALAPVLTPIIGQGGFTEIDFLLSKTRDFFGGKADDAGQAMRKLALETIPLFVSQGQTMEQGLERIRQQFNLAPKDVDAFRQALEQLGGVSQLSLPTRIADLQQSQKFAELQKRAPKFANQFGNLFPPEFLARQSLEDSLVDAAKHPAGEAGRASILAALAALVGAKRMNTPNALSKFCASARRSMTGSAH